jgi:glycosyl hydrolase family 26
MSGPRLVHEQTRQIVHERTHRMVLPGHVFVCIVASFLVTAGVASTASAAHRRPHVDPYPLAERGPDLPDTGAWFGSNAALKDEGDSREEALNGFESLIDRKVAVKRQYHLWNDEFPDDFDRYVRDRGTTLVMSWQTELNGEVDATWKDISTGRYDSLIDARAADIKAYGAPLFFTFDHEPEMKDSGTSSQFISAWRHIHDRFVAKGVTNVSWVLILLSYTYMNDGADAWYPGDAYVDLLGADGYNWFKCPPGVWKTFDELFDDFYDYGEAKGMDMLIAEWGTIEKAGAPGAKGAWFTEAEADLKTMPDIKVVSYYNNGISGGANCDWWVDTSGSSLAAFTAMGLDPYFNPPPPLISVTGPSDPNKDATPTFTFSSNLPGTLFTCSVDGGTAKVCISPSTTRVLADGVHTFTIVGTDPLSGQTNTVVYTWTVDSTPPVISILWGPSENTDDTDAHFTLDTSEQDQGGFTCSLDEAPESDCTRSVDYTGLSDGVHTFVATAYDDAGNVSDPVTQTWTVDTISPRVKITSGPDGESNSKSATFEFVSNEPDATFTCSKDGGTYLTCTSPKTYDWLGDGPHTLSVIAKDPARNQSAPDDWAWTVDATAPTVTITSGPPDPNTWDSVTMKFTADEEDVTFTCQLDEGPETTCTSPKTYTISEVGRHTFYVYGTDALGNAGRTVRWSWTKSGEHPGRF